MATVLESNNKAMEIQSESDTLAIEAKENPKPTMVMEMDSKPIQVQKDMDLEVAESKKDGKDLDKKDPKTKGNDNGQGLDKMESIKEGQVNDDQDVDYGRDDQHAQRKSNEPKVEGMLAVAKTGQFDDEPIMLEKDLIDADQSLAEMEVNDENPDIEQGSNTDGSDSDWKLEVALKRTLMILIKA